MLHSTLGAFLPPLRSVDTASDSDSPSAFSCLRLKDLREEVAEEPKDTPEISGSHTGVPNRNNNSRRVEQSNCSFSVVETTNTSAVTPSPVFSRSSSAFLAPRSMWQEAIRRKRYLLDRTGESGGDKGGGGQARRIRSPDWLYESYYCMSQQHPLIVFLLLIVMGACLALLTVFFASGLVSCSFMMWHTQMYNTNVQSANKLYKQIGGSLFSQHWLLRALLTASVGNPCQVYAWSTLSPGSVSMRALIPERHAYSTSMQ